MVVANTTLSRCTVVYRLSYIQCVLMKEMSNSIIWKSFNDCFHLVCSGKQACSPWIPVSLSWLPSQNQFQQLLQCGIRPLLRDLTHDCIRQRHHTADKRNEDSDSFWKHCKLRGSRNIGRSSEWKRKKSEDLIALLSIGSREIRRFAKTEIGFCWFFFPQ